MSDHHKEETRTEDEQAKDESKLEDLEVDAKRADDVKGGVSSADQWERGGNNWKRRKG